MWRDLLHAEKETLLWTSHRVHLTIPSVLARGETFSLQITTFGPDEMPTGSFDREIVFEQSPGIENLPKSIRLSADDEGFATIDGLRAVGPDRAFVVARPRGCPAPVRSNPAWVFDDPPYRIFWGDIHVHTTYSNCSSWACKDPEFAYAYARDASHLHFAAAADHLRGIVTDQARWPRLQELVRLCDQPGRFVPLLAFESSHNTGFGGDNNAYFLHADAPYFWPDREDMRGTSPEVKLCELWDWLDATGKEYFTVPHHTGRASKCRRFPDDGYDPDREPVFEIYSMWGSSESRPSRFPLLGGNSDEPCYFRDALRAGCRYGAIASSDTHLTTPGGQDKHSLAGGDKRQAGHAHKGLTAVRAKELTRESLWAALRSRSCYATTFERTLLDVSIGEARMGRSLPISRGDSSRRSREIRVRALSSNYEPDPLHVVLIRNGEEIERRPWDPDNPELIFRDEEPLDKIALRDAPFHPEPFVVYYARVESYFDQTQWSSPIWLDLE